MLACAIEAIGVYVSVALPNQAGIIIAAALLGSTFPGITALALLEGQARFHGAVRVSTAILTSAFSMGQMIGPYLAGIIIDMTGQFATAMTVSACTLMLAAFLMLHPQRLSDFQG